MKKLLTAMLTAITLMVVAVPAFAQGETAVASTDILSEKFVITDYLLVNEYLRGPIWNWVMSYVDPNFWIETAYNAELRLDAGGAYSSEIPHGAIRVGNDGDADMFINYAPMYSFRGPFILGEYGDTAYVYDTQDSTFTSNLMFGVTSDSDQVVLSDINAGFILAPGWYNTFDVRLKRSSGAGHDTSVRVVANIVCSTDTLGTLLDWEAPWGESIATATVTGTTYGDVSFTPDYPIYVPNTYPEEIYSLQLSCPQDTSFLYSRCYLEYEDSVNYGGPPVLTYTTNYAVSPVTRTLTYRAGEIDILAGMLAFSADINGALNVDEIYADNGADSVFIVDTAGDTLLVVGGIIIAP